MRTTVEIDDDVLLAARHIADTTGQSLGHTLSALARAALTRSSDGEYRNGIKLLPIDPNAHGSTMEHVNALRDELE